MDVDGDGNIDAVEIKVCADKNVEDECDLFPCHPREHIRVCARINTNVQLSTILKHVKGVDLNRDGVVSREETELARIEKGKEIYARTFLAENVSSYQSI